MSITDDIRHEEDIAGVIERDDLARAAYNRLVGAARDRMEDGGAGSWCDGFLDGAVTMAAQTFLELFLGGVPWANADDALAAVVRVATGRARLGLTSLAR